MKKYINAELQIVRVDNYDIVTSSRTLNVLDSEISNSSEVYAPGRDFEDF